MGKASCGNRNHKSESREIIIAIPEDMPEYKKPVCEECGFTAISRGHEWGCPNCGHRWVKKIRRPCKDCPFKEAVA